MYILDTTAVSAWMHFEPEFISFLRRHVPEDIRIVQPVIAEIEYGIRRLPDRSRKRELLEQTRETILDSISVLPWDTSASEVFGSIKAEMERTGRTIDDFDLAIGAIAIHHRHAVITANLAHFQMIPGLESRHWAR